MRHLDTAIAVALILGGLALFLSALCGFEWLALSSKQWAMGCGALLVFLGELGWLINRKQ